MEEAEVPLEHLHEKMEHEAAHASVRWIAWVALSSAILAALAALASLQSGDNANEAMTSQVESEGHWNYYQDKSLKESLLQSKADILRALNQPVPAKDEEKSVQYERDKLEIKEQAEKLEHRARHQLSVHKIFARSVTMFQIAIAIGAISIVVRQRVYWVVSLVLGAMGLAFLIQAFFT